jgi:hypothetical protein
VSSGNAFTCCHRGFVIGNDPRYYRFATQRPNDIYVDQNVVSDKTANLGDCD